MIPAPETTSLTEHPDADTLGRQDIPVTRLSLPFVMVIAFGVFLAMAGYAVGGVMSGIARDKTETEKRLSAIENEVTEIKNILAEHTCFPRVK